jgi:hypothetical protein
MRRTVYLAVAAVLACAAPWLQGQDQKTEIQRRLTSLFTLTKLTADNRDIATAGSVLTLHKDGLLMFSLDVHVAPTSTYKDGKMSMGFGEAFKENMSLSLQQTGTNVSNVPQRKFVTGEKFWIIGFVVKDDGVTLQFYSDPYDDVRYYGQVKFPIAKHSSQPADEVLRAIGEVVTTQQTDNSSAAATPQQRPSDPAPIAPPPPADASPAVEPIAPPPPPADAPQAPPKTISLGQTKAQVEATFGQPQKVVDLGAKKIYIYPDMKVTFINGKVTAVQ